MSKYEKLWNYIKTNKKDSITLTFEEIAIILNFSVDHSFLQHKKELLQYGYKVGKISLKEKKITFEKC